MIEAKQQEQFSGDVRERNGRSKRDPNKKRGCPDREERVSSAPLSTPFRDYSLAALRLHHLLQGLRFGTS